MRKIKFIFTVCFLLFASVASADFYYIGRWDWHQDPDGFEYWRGPHHDLLTGIIDLRSRPEAAQKGPSPHGWGMFSFSEEINDPSMVYLGDSLDSPIPLSARGALSGRWGLQVSDISLREVIYKLLTEAADPAGQTRWRPLRPGRDGKMKIFFGVAGKIKEQVMVIGSPEWEMVRASIQHDYRQKLKTESHVVIAKWLDYQQEKYGVDYREFIPSDTIQIAALPHATSQTDDFNCADSETLGCDLSWTILAGDIDVASSVAYNDASATTTSLARADADVSGTDHFAEADVTDIYAQANSVPTTAGVFVRKDSSATETFYAGRYRHYSNSPANSDRHYLYKAVSGTWTELSNQTGQTLPSLPYPIRITADGSTITFDVNGVEELNVTNSDITTGTRGGLYARRSHTTGITRLDDFEVTDLGGAAGPKKGSVMVVN